MAHKRSFSNKHNMQLKVVQDQSCSLNHKYDFCMTRAAQALKSHEIIDDVLSKLHVPL